MDKIEKIRQEIERRRLHFNKEAEKYQALNNGYSQNCYGARDALRDLENFLDTLSEEPDKSLEEAADDYADYNSQRWQEDGDIYYDHPKIVAAFIAGAEWQKEQFEKNRLAACDAQTREEYERETDFVDKFLTENPFCTPTFSDAINYGIAWQKERMMKDAIEGEAHPDDCEIWANLVGYGYKFNDSDKVKIVIVKED